MSSSFFRPALRMAASSAEGFAELEAHAGRGRIPGAALSAVPSEANAVIRFWRDAGPALWFAKDPAFDTRFRERFLTLHEAAASGELNDWTAIAPGSLALILLLDQYPRNSFRGTPRMYATDAAARAAADAALKAGHDQAFPADLRVFFNLPFAHSEDLADQDRSVALAEGLGEPNISHAQRHRSIVARFGRFPHRNPILGRVMRADEQQFLDEGGYAG
jgi:uncharacterized protein (DUF924 family)